MAIITLFDSNFYLTSAIVFFFGYSVLELLNFN